MNPEERFTRIENLLQAMTEHHAQHQEELRKHSEQIAKNSDQIAKHSEQIEKNTAGIRDLIVVNRTVLTSIQGLNEAIQRLVQAQTSTDERLNILIETVDRIIGRRE